MSASAGWAEGPAGATGWRRLYEGWMAIVGRFGAVQTLVILAFSYLAVVGPVAVVGAVLRRDFLDKRELRGRDSAWRVADSAAPDLERAKRQS